jgi:sugar phosphate isomerase/epimerase
MEFITARPVVHLTLDWQEMHTKGTVPDDRQCAFFQRQRARIRELNLHDMMDGEGRSHPGPGQGTLDFRKLFSDFYPGDQWLTLEIRPFAEAAAALRALTRILKSVIS